MTGRFVAVVGQSGVGKDSLISYAQSKLGEQLVVVRRVVTRHAEASSEAHDSLSLDAFEEAENAGAFALSWEAHGLRYGLPICFEDDLARGRVVIANLSRAMLSSLLERYENATIIEFTAHPDVIEQRLLGRGRESVDDIAQRLTRNAPPVPETTIRIDNSADIGQAGDEFVALLRGFMRESDRA